jgi:hypothetical protein
MLQNRTCIQCSKIFIGGPRAYYCPDCRVERVRETNRQHKQRRKFGTFRKLGSSDICERCGKDYIVMGGLQKFCEDCKKIHAMEYDRITSLKYYKLNKHIINPVRNKRRRLGTRTCAWCHEKFETHTSKITCSDECGRSLKNHMWNIRAIKRRKRLNKN